MKSTNTKKRTKFILTCCCLTYWLQFHVQLFNAANAFQSQIRHCNDHFSKRRKATDKKIRTTSSSPYQYSTALTSTKYSGTTKEGGISSSLISNLAIIALKLRLSSHSSVQCNVQSSTREILLKQTIGPVSVSGRDWESPLGLTCKAIQADVDTCRLDMNSVLTKRKLILLEPAKGAAMIAFDKTDFGNFLMHPLLQSQLPSLSRISNSDNSGSSLEDNKFVFQNDDVSIVIDERMNNNGCIVFYGKCMGQRWKCILKRGMVDKADIEVIHQERFEGKALSEEEIQSLEVELSMVVTNFFTRLRFELDGTFLSFKDLKFHLPKKSNTATSIDNNDANIMFALDITVKKFPSPGLAF